jgi:prepilin-type N-terminal cleavage/methylation domain-containing protein
MKNNSGFTLVELLIVIAIFIIIYGLAVQAFSLFRKEGELSNSAEEILNILRLAQSRTLASEGASQYGVYFDTTPNHQQYTLFKGSSYVSRNPPSDEVREIPKSVDLYEVSLGGSQEVVFDRLVGDTKNFGKISLRLKSDNSKTKTIAIQSSGKITLGEEAAPTDNGRIKDSRHVHFNYSRLIDTTTENLILTFTYDSSTVIQTVPISSNMSAGQIYWEGEVNVNGQNQKIEIQTHYLNNPDTLFSIHRDRRFNNKALTISISGDSSGNLIEYSADGLTTSHPSNFVNNFQWQ